MRPARQVTPGAPAGRVPPAARMDGRADCGCPAGKISPWCRQASTTTVFRRCPTAKVLNARVPNAKLPNAKTEAADPSPVLAQADIRRPRYDQPAYRRVVPATVPQRSPALCDLLHKGLGRLALNHRNGPGNPPIVVRSAERPSHRLRLDRHWRRNRFGRADLSDPDLMQRADGGSVSRSPPQ